MAEDAWEFQSKPKNTLPLYGNKESMNLNSMILTNIQSSAYFKEDLIELKTFHEVIDEIYYKVEHLEPWEKNSRKLSGQVGMCAGVRGVAAGGIVSTAYCLLFKLFTFKLTRKQLTAMLKHRDSAYIRGIGFMYIRYCQPPADFWKWFGPYIDDAEDIDLKAGGGYTVTIGEMCRMMLTKLEWFGTLFPRLPVNVQKDVEAKLKAAKLAARQEEANNMEPQNEWGEAARVTREERVPRPSPPERKRSRSRSPKMDRDRHSRRDRSSSRERRRDTSRERRRDRSRERWRSRERRRTRSRSRDRRGRSRSRERRRRSRSRERRRSRSRERRRSSSRDRQRSRSRDRSGRNSKSHDRH